MKRIAIFASGSGSNAEVMIRHFSASPLARVTLLLSNNPEAGALARAKNLGVETVVFDRELFHSSAMAGVLASHGIDYIVLAGFLWLVPPALVDAYRDRIVNIHPALLPAYGGKGMYGERVHRAVLANGEKESGITIHKVNELYDSGDMIAQYRLAVRPDDTPETLASRIHALEHRYFPLVIEAEIIHTFKMEGLR